MKDALAKYTHLPPGLQKQYEKINKTAYYYKAQVKEYKNILKDPQKIEATTLKMLNKIPAFQTFMQQNSQLASLFALPQNYATAASLSGLQTRNSVQQIIQQRVASGGPSAMQQVQQNLSQAHAEMNKLKDRMNQIANGGGDPDMPDFKPNNQKTKSFLKRLEYGFDVQFSKSKSLLPSGSDIGLSVGYKPNDKSLAGLGLSYKMGMGSMQHLRLSSEGLGLRSFVDYKIKNQFYLSGGYEMNYLSGFEKIEELKEYAAWQRSALIGLSKKYKINKKFKGEMKLLYDFLHREHVPVSRAVVWRLGYKF